MKILLNITQREADNQGILKQMLREVGCSAVVSYKPLEISECTMIAKKHRCGAVVTSHPDTLKNITPGTEKASSDDWRGSVLATSVPIIVIAPLAHVFSKPQGRWLLQNDLNKLNAIKAGTHKFLYDYAIPKTLGGVNSAIRDLRNYPCLVIDIETTLTNKISSIAFTPVRDDLTLGKSYTFPLLPRDITDDPLSTLTASWTGIREILADASITKVFHNGCFDAFHLLRFHCPVVNWFFDTEYMWHCWEAEAKKSLAFIASVLLDDYYYWKHESELSPLEYNAKDTINTARVFIQLLKRMPKWAWFNYAITIPNAIPIIKTQFEGFRVDKERKAELRGEAVAERDRAQAELEKLIGIPDFNCGSPKQVNALIYRILRAKVPPRAKSKSATGELELKKVAMQHPILARIVPLILTIREERKAISTYYDARLTDSPYDKLLYSLQLDGTETERMACKSSSLWAPFTDINRINKSNAKNLGTQAQNLPYYYKKAIMAEEGYEILEIDKSQSEARCTAYLSEDKSLREALETPGRDFYCHTGFLFFGIEFDKAHALRQVVKKIIHGTNYMMGAQTFIDSVGVNELHKYRKLVGYTGDLKSFANYLLELYHVAYPGVHQWWDRIVIEIASTGKLVTPDGWTRKFHGNIGSNHAIKRSAVAHCSQHFSVRGVNKAFWRVFYEIELPTGGDYRLKAQVHDSLVGSIRADPSTKATTTKQLLDIMYDPQPTPIGDLIIPLDVEGGKYWKSD
mgnify:CR=1 FL=1